MSFRPTRNLPNCLPLALILATLAGCTHLFYQPSRALYADPHRAGIAFTQESFRSSDGTTLYGWYFPAQLKAGEKSHGVIIQFHGNAENMSSHFESLVWVTHRGYDLFAFDYRGYGRSEGEPSQAGVNGDALAAIRYVEQHHAAQDAGTRDIVLYGQSLGGAIMLRALSDLEDRSRIRAVVADSTFYSYQAIARDFVARSWVTWIFQPLAYVLVSDEYSPERAIPRVSPIPLLVIHGDRDGVVPVDFGRHIAELAHDPKALWVIPGAHHIQSMQVDEGRYQDKLVDYLDSLR
jgi:fermentation-respiration switch protein FrsA (DUF1100 family)